MDPAGDTVYELKNLVVIGRLPSCDLPVDDMTVSRQHARLIRMEQGFAVQDLESANGTLVNGQRIRQVVTLHPGDVITIGPVNFRYEWD